MPKPGAKIFSRASCIFENNVLILQIVTTSVGTRFMKHISATFLAAVLCEAVLTACSGGESDNIDFGEAIAERRVKLAEEEGSPECKVLLRIKYAREEQGAAAQAINHAIESRLLGMERLPMQEAADSFANEYTRRYRHDMGPLYRADRADTARRAWYEYRYVTTTDTQRERKGVVTYLISTDRYEGGAHGISQLLAINFNIKTGKPLTLDDVFVPGYSSELNKLLLQALKDKVGAGSMQELNEKGYLLSMDMYAPRNFILGDEAITFIYNIYEIAPYSTGKTELTLDYDDLEKILKKTE